MPRDAACAIYTTNQPGSPWSQLKKNSGWTRTGPNGRVRRLSAEQLRSHLLPLLGADQPGLSVRAERRSRSEDRLAGVECRR